jgi:hypothetical protein
MSQINFTQNQVVPSLSITGVADGGAVYFYNAPASGRRNWQIGNSVNSTNVLDFTPSTANDGSTFTTPCFRVGLSTVTLGPTSGAGVHVINGLTGLTVGAAGAASALPATPAGYLSVSINGTTVKLPYYN